MSLNEHLAWIGVDWGTSNLRAWAMSETGTILAAARSDQGMGTLTRADYPAALAAVAADLGVSDASGFEPSAVEVLICGMAGARQGWLEAPYLEAPTDLSALRQGAVRPEPVAGLRPAILPGICQRRGGDNVMRGEETQLLGLAALWPGYAGLVCMPGTHSKWAVLEGTRIERFATAMTGEIFALLKHHSVLRHSLTDTSQGATHDAGFTAGIEDGLARPEQLLGQLFGVRAGALLSGRSPDWGTGYLSGLLIGTEIAANRALIGSAPVPLIGSKSLCGLYETGLRLAGASSRHIDATQAVLAGLAAARQKN